MGEIVPREKRPEDVERGHRIRDIRKQRYRASQQEWAVIADVARETVVRWEAGETAELENLRRAAKLWAQHYSFDPAEILAMVDEVGNVELPFYGQVPRSDWNGKPIGVLPVSGRFDPLRHFAAQAGGFENFPAVQKFDVLICDPKAVPAPGDLVVLAIDSEIFCARVVGDRAIPDSPGAVSYDLRECEFLGKVRTLIRHFE